MSSQVVVPALLSTLEHLRAAAIMTNRDKSYACGWIRGLDVAAETFTLMPVPSEGVAQQLHDRASRIEDRDAYHDGCAAAIRLVLDLLTS